MSKAVEAVMESEWVALPAGRFRRDPNNPQHGWIICAGCPEPQGRYAYIPSKGSKAFRHFTGRCRACEGRRRRETGIRRKTGVEAHSSGAVLLKGTRDPKNLDRVAFLCPDCCPTISQVNEHLAACGMLAGDVSADDLRRVLKALGARCGKVHFVLPGDVRDALRKTPWSGRCKECRFPNRFKVIELNGGGKFRPDPSNPQYGWVICPDCISGATEKERYRRRPTGKGLQGFLGLCMTHARLRQRTLTGIKTHPSGAILLLDERDPNVLDYRAAFICANFMNGGPLENRVQNARAGRADEHHPDCFVRAYGWLSMFRKPGWCGLCESCLRARVDPRKVITDVILNDGLNGGPGTQILFSREDDKGLVPVKYWLCGHEMALARSTIISGLSAHRAGKRRWPARCRHCFYNPSELAERLLQAGTINGNRNGNEGKRGVGRPVEDRTEEHALLKARFESIILSLLAELPPHKITRAKITDKYNRLGESLVASTVTMRVQLLYGKDVAVADVVELVAAKNRQNNSSNLFDTPSK